MRKKQLLVLALGLLFGQCVFYNEAVTKQEERKPIMELLALVELYNQFTEFKEIVDLFTLWETLQNNTDPDLPDTSGTDNNTNTYPGSAPTEGSTTIGVCYLETDKSKGSGRDYCCYGLPETSCYDGSLFFGDDYTPTFDASGGSGEVGTCTGQGFVACLESAACCYN